MYKIILLATAAGLAGCNSQKAAGPANDVNVAVDANASVSTPVGSALASINETSWEFTDPETGKAMQESVDAAGDYIVVSGKEHIDHGTAMMKDGKACFTSAMNKDGEICWSDPMIAEGQSGETTNNQGDKLAVKRTAYVPLTM